MLFSVIEASFLKTAQSLLWWLKQQCCIIMHCIYYTILQINQKQDFMSAFLVFFYSTEEREATSKYERVSDLCFLLPLVIISHGFLLSKVCWTGFSPSPSTLLLMNVYYKSMHEWQFGCGETKLKWADASCAGLKGQVCLVVAVM